MGKKKHKHHGHKHYKHGKHDRAEMRFDVPPQVAGIAAAALEQVNTPAFRQLMAGALGAAAQAFDQRRAPPPPAPPEPAAAPYQPHFETPEIALPPQAAEAIERAAGQAGRAIESAAGLVAQAMETAATALEQWAARHASRGDEGSGRPPH